MLRTLNIKREEFPICHALANSAVFCSHITILIHLTLDFPIRHSNKSVAFTESILKVAIYVLGLIVRSDALPDLAEILGRPCGHRRGVGNSFQPAIDASRFHLINCVIAPSAKMNVCLDIGACMSMNCSTPLQTLWALWINILRNSV
jgi:hypothetical protein